MKTLGEKIRELRRKKGLSQEELAFEIGISRQTVSKWESDSMQPTTENIRSLCDFFDVTAEYFIGNYKPAIANEVAETVIATATTEVADENVESSSNTAIRKPYSKKKILVLTLLTSLSAIVFVAGVLLGGISIYNLTRPKLGFDDHHGDIADELAIVGCILALAALTAIIVLIVLLKRNKKKQNRKFC